MKTLRHGQIKNFRMVCEPRKQQRSFLPRHSCTEGGYLESHSWVVQCCTKPLHFTAHSQGHCCLTWIVFFLFDALTVSLRLCGGGRYSVSWGRWKGHGSVSRTSEEEIVAVFWRSETWNLLSQIAVSSYRHSQTIRKNPLCWYMMECNLFSD